MLLLDADRQFKVLLANYICSNLCKFQKNHNYEVNGKLGA